MHICYHEGWGAGLEARGASLAEAVLAFVGLQDMAHFADMNRVYSLHFPAVNPAARACIQLPLSASTGFVLEVLAIPKGRLQACLHHICKLFSHISLL